LRAATISCCGARQQTMEIKRMLRLLIQKLTADSFRAALL
jgi:hypothetical protein